MLARSLSGWLAHICMYTFYTFTYVLLCLHKKNVLAPTYLNLHLFIADATATLQSSALQLNWNFLNVPGINSFQISASCMNPSICPDGNVSFHCTHCYFRILCGRRSQQGRGLLCACSDVDMCACKFEKAFDHSLACH